jgi:hypothetical protein
MLIGRTFATGKTKVYMYFKLIIWLVQTFTRKRFWAIWLAYIFPSAAPQGMIDPKPGMSHYIPCLIAE